jgi:hypothetical protein
MISDTRSRAERCDRGRSRSAPLSRPSLDALFASLGFAIAALVDLDNAVGEDDGSSREAAQACFALVPIVLESG